MKCKGADKILGSILSIWVGMLLPIYIKPIKFQGIWVPCGDKGWINSIILVSSENPKPVRSKFQVKGPNESPRLN